MRSRITLAVIVSLAVVAGRTYGAFYLPTNVGEKLKLVGYVDSHGNLQGDTSYPDGGTVNTILGKWNGGEFKFDVYSADDTYLGYFVTFCAQTSETISPGQTYTITGFDDSVSEFADWIYWGYLDNDEKDNVVFDRVTAISDVQALSTNDEAGIIQDALWRALGQSYKGWSNGVYATWLDKFNHDAEWKSRRLVAPQVAILGCNQDQWVYVPIERNPPVPEPASLLIWSLLGLGSSGLAVWSRRRSRRRVEHAGWSSENRQAILSIIERGRM